jgi:hypothetical protein
MKLRLGWPAVVAQWQSPWLLMLQSGVQTSAIFALDDAVVPVPVGLVIPLRQGDLLLAEVTNYFWVEVVETDPLALDVDLEGQAEDQAAGRHQLQPHQHPSVVLLLGSMLVNSFPSSLLLLLQNKLLICQWKVNLGYFIFSQLRFYSFRADLYVGCSYLN